jgi:signal transduction histidine kinase
MQSLRQGLAYLQQLADGMHFLATNETTSDGTPAAVGSTDLVDWWTTVEPLLRSVVPTRAVFEASFAPRLPEIGMSSSALTQVMLNLLVNSADALEQRHGKRASGGSLLISFSTELRSRRRFVRVCVSDNGSGMSEEVRLRSREPFYTTKPRGRGTGLGLAVIQRAMDEVEGAVEIESTLGEGTWISLRVPARRAE